MKITVDVDCTPLEARQFMGLPDVEPMQKAAMAQIEKRMMAELERYTPGGAVQGLAAARRHERRVAPGISEAIDLIIAPDLISINARDIRSALAFRHLPPARGGSYIGSKPRNRGNPMVWTA